MTAWRQARAVGRIVPMTARLGRRAAQDIRQLGEALDAAFPSEPVRYLQILGVAPTAQGRGIGTRLLGSGLDAADAERVDIYLETGKSANVAYYRSHGFALVAPGGPLYPGGPPMWRMRRPPGT